MRLLRRNLAATYGMYAASVLSGLVITPIVVNALGLEAYGVWAVITGLTIYLGLLDLGVGPTVVRFAAEYRGRGAREAMNELASAGLVVYGVVGALTLAAGFALAWIVPEVFDLPPELVWPARVATLLAVAAEAARFPLALAANLLAGHQRYDVLNLASFASLVVYGVLVVAVLTQTGGLALLAAFALVAALVRLLLPLPWLRRELPSLSVSRRLVTRQRLRELLTTSRDNMLIRLAARLALGSDVVIVGLVLGVESAALYAIAAKLWGTAFAVGTAGTNMLYPAYAELEGAEDELRQRLLLRGGLRAGMAAMLLFALPLLFLPEQLMEAWVRKELDASVPVLALLAVALVLHQPTHVASQYLIARGRHGVVARISVPIAVANVVASVVLASTVGLWGVALAILLTEAATLAVIPVLTARASGVPLLSLARSAFRPLLPALALGALLLGVGGRLYDADDLLSLLPLGIAWVALYVPIVWRVGFNDRERETLARRLRGRATAPAAAAP